MVDFYVAFLFIDSPNMRKLALQDLMTKGLQNIDQDFIDLFVFHFFSFYERVNPEAITALLFLKPKIRLTVFLEHFDTFLNQYFSALNQIFIYENIPIHEESHNLTSNEILPEQQEKDETTKIMLQYDITELDAFYYLNFDLDTELETRNAQIQDPFYVPYQNRNTRENEVDLFNEFDDFEEDISEDEMQYRKRRLYNRLESMFTVFEAILPVISQLKSLEIMERMRFIIIRSGFRNFNLEYGSSLTKLIVNIKHLSNCYFICMLDFNEELIQFLITDFQKINYFSHPDLLFNILYYSDSRIASTFLTTQIYQILKEKKILASPYSYLMFYRIILKHKIEPLYEILLADIEIAKATNKIMWLYIFLLANISEKTPIFINEILDIFIAFEHNSIRNLSRYFIINFALTEDLLLFFEYKYKQNPNALSVINEFKSIIKEIDSKKKDHTSDIIL